MGSIRLSRSWLAGLLGSAGLLGVGCGEPGAAPTQPTWADVSPVLRGECNGCHGYAAGDMNNPAYPYRFDFFDVDQCGAAANAIDAAHLTLAGSANAALQIYQDVVPIAGVRWPRMPPQPSPAVADWEVETLRRWSQLPVKGPPQTGDRPPTLEVSQLPLQAGVQLGFTAIIDDPDGDSVIGVVQANGYSYYMNRPGSFAVRFDSSQWAAGPVDLQAVICDGWSSTTIKIGTVQIQH
jgi:hypothetical protein